MRCNATHVQHNCNGEKEIELESEKKKEIDLNQKKKNAPIKNKKI